MCCKLHTCNLPHRKCWPGVWARNGVLLQGRHRIDCPLTLVMLHFAHVVFDLFLLAYLRQHRTDSTQARLCVLITFDMRGYGRTEFRLHPHHHLLLVLEPY